MIIGAVIVAGGSGTRMKRKEKKQYLKLKNKPIFIITLTRMSKIKEIDKLVLVIPREDRSKVENYLEKNNISGIKLAFSGKRRQDSVFNGLKKLERCDYVIIHDGVRPFFRKKMVKNGINGLKKFDAVITAVPLNDTIKLKKDNLVIETINRDQLAAVQTPQFFKFDKLFQYYKEYNKLSFTDDSYLFELKRENISIIMGAKENIKITTPFDYKIAKCLVKEGFINV